MKEAMTAFQAVDFLFGTPNPVLQGADWAAFFAQNSYGCPCHFFGPRLYFCVKCQRPEGDCKCGTDQYHRAACADGVSLCVKCPWSQAFLRVKSLYYEPGTVPDLSFLHKAWKRNQKANRRRNAVGRFLLAALYAKGAGQ